MSKFRLSVNFDASGVYVGHTVDYYASTTELEMLDNDELQADLMMLECVRQAIICTDSLTENTLALLNQEIDRQRSHYHAVVGSNVIR